MTIDINNRQTLDYDEAIITHVIKCAIAREIDTELSEPGEVSVSIVDNKEMQELNRKYRDIDAPTDVLSFSMGGYMLGDIVISLEKAVEQAEEYGHSIGRELGFLVAHGILHLLGYDHQTDEQKQQMRIKEEKTLSGAMINEF